MGAGPTALRRARAHSGWHRQPCGRKRKRSLVRNEEGPDHGQPRPWHPLDCPGDRCRRFAQGPGQCECGRRLRRPRRRSADRDFGTGRRVSERRRATVGRRSASGRGQRFTCRPHAVRHRPRPRRRRPAEAAAAGEAGRQRSAGLRQSVVAVGPRGRRDIGYRDRPDAGPPRRDQRLGAATAPPEGVRVRVGQDRAPPRVAARTRFRAPPDPGRVRGRAAVQ